MVHRKKTLFHSNFKNQLMEITEKTTIKEIFQHLFDLFADSDIPAAFDMTHLEFVKRSGHNGGVISFYFFENDKCVDIVYVYKSQQVEGIAFNVQKITNIINTIKNDNT
jgi:hypothetical protein